MPSAAPIAATFQALPQSHPENGAGLGSECHSHTELLGPLRHGEVDRSVNSHSGEKNRQSGEQRDQAQAGSRSVKLGMNLALHGFEIVNRVVRSIC